MLFTTTREESVDYVTDLLETNGYAYVPADWQGLRGGESHVQLEEWVAGAIHAYEMRKQDTERLEKLVKLNFNLEQ